MLKVVLASKPTWDFQRVIVRGFMVRVEAYWFLV